MDVLMVDDWNGHINYFASLIFQQKMTGRDENCQMDV